jgi:pimeloyl-ACP methyl ester carboxylesterase
MSRVLLRFENRKGITLKGMRFDPDEVPARPRFVIYLPGIVLGCAAVHRLGMKIGEHLAALGFRTLLFDHSGIGESEGSFQGGSHENLTDWVMRGALVDDTLDAISFVQREYQATEIYLVGHCGGSLTSAYAASQSDLIRGAFLIAPPTLGTGGRAQRHVDATEANLVLYRRKVFSWDAWKRLLSMESNLSEIGQALLSPIWKPKGPGGPVHDTFNMDLIRALRAMTERKAALRVFFGDHDPDLKHFLEFTKSTLAPPLAFTIQEDTRHGFLTPDSLGALLKAVGDFVSATPFEGWD